MEWLRIISYIALAIGLLSTLVIAIDVYKHPQMMWIMNLVWPINGWSVCRLDLFPLGTVESQR